MVVLTSSLSAIPCPCRTEEKSSTRGWLGCSSELCHKSNWTFLNICCGWLAQWLAEFDWREWKPVCLRVVCVCVCTQSLADLRMGILHIYFLTFFFLARERGTNYFLKQIHYPLNMFLEIIGTVPWEWLFQGHTLFSPNWFWNKLPFKCRILDGRHAWQFGFFSLF